MHLSRRAVLKTALAGATGLCSTSARRASSAASARRNSSASAEGAAMGAMGVGAMGGIAAPGLPYS